MSVLEQSAEPVARWGRRGQWAKVFQTPQGWAGLAILALILAFALIGPAVAPHAIDEPIGLPGEAAHHGAPLGTDTLGRDVLSRVLNGGTPVLWVAFVTTALIYLVGIPVGMMAGLSRSLLDPILMRIVDVFLVFPPLMLLLLLFVGAGTGVGVMIIGIILVLSPGVARLVRTATLEVSTAAFIEAAVARGERSSAIMRREVLPNIAPSIVADLGVRFSGVIILAASVNFLGFGSKPPATNWGLMIAENLSIVSTNVWAVLAPAILLALLTMSVNLLGDAYTRSLGRTLVRS
jgi:peptide/nickel transport system permease protein